MKSNVTLWGKIKNQLLAVAISLPVSLLLLWLILGDLFFNPLTFIAVTSTIPVAIYAGILYDKLICKIRK